MWDVKRRNSIERYESFGGTCCFHFHSRRFSSTPKMEAVTSPKHLYLSTILCGITAQKIAILIITSVIISNLPDYIRPNRCTFQSHSLINASSEGTSWFVVVLTNTCCPPPPRVCLFNQFHIFSHHSFILILPSLLHLGHQCSLL